ncbi:MAG: spermidine synthase [Alphaproteobacteria bacterium]|nr:spermidine synthase [Alphaproteobacteria bacterium]
MSVLFEELDYQVTDIGAISLRRRRDLHQDIDVFEVKLGDEFLMSSLFTASEIALAEFGLKRCAGDSLDVVVGGLGLGYTAQAVLQDPRVASLMVIEKLQPVIDWHQRNLVPLTPPLSADARCKLVCGDFFVSAQSGVGFDTQLPGRHFDAILVDIDHTPDLLLAPESADFYAPEGLVKLSTHLKPGGVFGLWSNLPPDDSFTQRLDDAFAAATAEAVTFHNPIQLRDVTQTVYLATKARSTSDGEQA